MSDDADDWDESWAGGADMSAAKAEIERLKRLGEGLRDLSKAAARISDPNELAAIQDRNIVAFEKMTAEMGLAALDRMRETLKKLSDPEAAAESVREAAEKNAGLLAAAREEIEANRNEETAKLIRRFTDQMQAAASRGLETARKAATDMSILEFEPFEHGPTPKDAAQDAREDGPLAEMPSEEDD